MAERTRQIRREGLLLAEHLTRSAINSARACWQEMRASWIIGDGRLRRTRAK
jgi:hypothetical protein